jgi:predicted MFS family arabinose efflux permease
MILGDTAVGLSTIVVLLLLLTNNLQIWHLYITGAINGLFGYFQNLAQSASISMIVPKQHYTRAGAMIYYALAGSKMMAPALAGLLYYIIGLSGILMIDLVTFLIGISTVILVKIPQPKQSEYRHSNRNLWQELTFGFRYIFKRPSLLATLIFLLSFYLVNNTIYAIRSPMILARSRNNGAVLANVQLAIGVGGVIGAMLLSIWGGPKRRIHGLLLGSAFASGSLMGLGLGNQPWIWMSAGFFMAFFSPLMDSSYTAIWLSKVEPDVQGRVFASRYLITQIASPLGLAIAGPLADHIFEPAMRTGGSLA